MTQTITRSSVAVLLTMLLLANVGRRVEAAYVSRFMLRRAVCRQSLYAPGHRQFIRIPFGATSDDFSQDFLQEPTDGTTVARSLLGSALGRAMRTMSTKADLIDENDTATTVQSILQDVATAIESPESRDGESRQSVYRSSANIMLGNAIGRATRTFSTKATTQDESSGYIAEQALPDSRSSSAKQPLEQIDDYLANPAINPTALAHKTWSHVLRPNVDTAIDATCGNGNDSEAIASMLFSSADSSTVSNVKPQLICIDIQKEACESTRDRLFHLLDDATMEHNVHVVQTSHAPLPRPWDESSVGLVCYNLGYLPQSNNQGMLTQMDTTVSSIADAALLLRVGGMLSVMTYPRSNLNEDYAVHALLEGLALLTSKSVDIQDYVNELGPDPNDRNAYSVREAVRTALDRIVDEGPRKQTWRVMENKMLGRPLSPTLLTATRIK